MTDTGSSTSRRRHRGRSVGDDATYGPPPPELHPSIASLRGAHRAAHPDLGSVLEAATHMLMFQEWPINCPRFMERLRELGLECVTRLQFIKLDHHLLTALVERWSPSTNTFHLPVGEMTITLQDVGMILGLQLDGPPLIGSTVVGDGHRWQSWPNCCDDLIGCHPEPNIVYQDPRNAHITSTFRMGQAHAQTCLPLRWLRWTFFQDSYLHLTELDFRRHIRAYILFLLGCFLLPDTSGSEVHLQYLPLLEDLELFSTHSIGGAVLAHLYRELKEATKPRRANIGGCVHLLQVWSWERLHVGRPTLHIPFPQELDGLSVGCRWNEQHVREVPTAHVKEYRDQIDGLLQSQVIWEPYGMLLRTQVAYICLSGEEIWRARVPLINWRRVEWHLPDRVIRQFGGHPRIDMPPMDPNFRRVDGRGKADVDWVQYHQADIATWENRRAHIVSVVVDTDEDLRTVLRRYMRWYRSWASLYLLAAPTEAPTTYYPRAPVERLMRDHIMGAEELLQPFYGLPDDSPRQHAINAFEEMCSDFRRKVFFDDMGSAYAPERGGDPSFHSGTVAPDTTMPATFADEGPSTYQGSFHQTPWPAFQTSGSGQYSGQQPQWPAFQTSGSGSVLRQDQQTAFMTPPVYTGGPHMMSYGQPFPMQYFSGYPYAPSPIVQQSAQMEAAQEQEEGDVQHQLRDRPVRGPQHYTPGSDALPHRRRRRH